MRFCMAINCMDGRAQLPVIHYLRRRFDVEFVDMVSEPGPNRILAAGREAVRTTAIEQRVRLSIDRHQSVGIAVIRHHDCAGNPAPRNEQIAQVCDAIEFLRPHCGGKPLIGLWVDENWQVEEV